MSASANSAKSIKTHLYEALVERLNSQIAELSGSLQDLQRSANEETKSSVGDKYETGRAMVQLEIEKIQQQLAEKNKAKNIVLSVSPSDQDNSVRVGSVIETSAGDFFLLVNAMDLKIGARSFMGISLQSPLGKLLFGKTKGEQIVLNGRTFVIKQVF
jgi:transcription elongation GreA/GreB family factor